MDIPFDDELEQATQGQLPLSRFTVTPPSADKWMKYKDEIESIMPEVEAAVDRLSQLRPALAGGS